MVSGSNFQVIKMLEEIGTPENVPTFVADVKAKKACQIGMMGIWVGRPLPKELCMSYPKDPRPPHENRGL